MAEPVTLAEAKAQTMMTDDDSQDDFLTSLIAPARAYCERYTRRLFVGGTRTQTFTRWGDYLEIWRQPITSIDSVTYSTTDDAADDEAYTGFVANLGFPTRISPGDGDEWPELITGGTITVTYTAGALTSTDEEYLIAKRAMLVLIGHWFKHRDLAATLQAHRDVAFTVGSILDELRPVSAY